MLFNSKILIQGLSLEPILKSVDHFMRHENDVIFCVVYPITCYFGLRFITDMIDIITDVYRVHLLYSGFCKLVP